MSTIDLEMNWVSFGKKMSNLGGVLLLIFVPYLAFVMLTIQFILTLVSISDMSNLNNQLKNPFLNNFRSKYLAASIIKFIGSIILHITCVLLVAILIFNIHIFPSYLFGPSLRFVPISILFIIGIIVMVIGSSIEMGAWTEFKSFLQSAKDTFPSKDFDDAIDGVENLHTGAFLWVLGFLFVPIIIGWIFQLVGYFKLANFAKLGLKTTITPVSTEKLQPVPTPESQTIPITPIETEETIKFCPMCGAKVGENGRYCGECGVQIRD